MDVTNKVVLVTGASAGIGRSTAQVFAEANAKIALLARSAEKLEELSLELESAGREVCAVPADMRDPEAVNKALDSVFDHFGRLDILINNAGQAAAGAIATVNMEHFRRIMDLNIYGVVYAIQAAVPKMRLGGGGIIINVSSMVSKMKIPGLGAYAATKSALNMLSDTARVELAADNIRVITMYPRATATDFGKNSLGDQRMRQQQRDRAAAHAYRVDTADDVAKRILLAAQTEPEEQFMEE